MNRLADDVLRRLRGNIVDGTYPPGERLTESQLCTAYDVSRVPVREALKHLEVEGFVTARAYAGVRVARMGSADAEDLFTVRGTIEAITARRAAERFTNGLDEPDEDSAAFAKRLTELVDLGRAALGSSNHDLPPLNTEFHLTIAEFGSTGLLPLLKQVAAKIEWLYAMDLDVRGEHSWAEHGAIADAVLSGRPDRAAGLMAEHVDNSREGYLLRHATCS